MEDFLFFFSVLMPHVQPCFFTSEVVLPSWWGSLERLAFFLVTISVLAISDCLLSFFAILLELSFCSYTDTAAGILGFPSESLSLFSSLICADDSGRSLGELFIIINRSNVLKSARWAMVYITMHGVMGLWYKLHCIGFTTSIVALAVGHCRVGTFWVAVQNFRHFQNIRPLNYQFAKIWRAGKAAAIPILFIFAYGYMPLHGSIYLSTPCGCWLISHPNRACLKQSGQNS